MNHHGRKYQWLLMTDHKLTIKSLIDVGAPGAKVGTIAKYAI